MIRKLLLIIAVIILESCKSKAILSDVIPVEKGVYIENNTLLEKIIQKQASNKSDFTTLYIRSSVDYKSEDNSQRVSAEIKIKKNEIILVSLRFLGITMAKAFITPTEVKYYEKINGTYFEGNYESISQLLGTDLNFNKLQNLLLGLPMEDIDKDRYLLTELSENYKFNSIIKNPEFSFLFDMERVLLKKQEVSQLEKERTFEVNYGPFQMVTSVFLPSTFEVIAKQKNATTNIKVVYNLITINEDLSYPYEVPNGYDKISIN